MGVPVRIDPFTPARLGPVTLRNRFLKAATFEGMAEDNLVSDRLIDFHRAMAAGGVGMTTLAYLAVCEDGQGAPNEIVVRPEAVPGLRRIADAVHAEGARISAQIGHAGPVAAATGRRGLAPSRMFSPMAFRFTRAIDEAGIARVVGAFASAAELLRDAGFDAVEVHLGHSYLLSAFLSPKLNRRTDRYGGSIAQRADVPRRAVQAVREAVGSSMAVLAKMNMVDGFKGGIDVPESLEAARLLESDGCLDALELSGGSSLMNPMFMFKGDAPIEEMALAFPQPIRTAFRLMGRRFLPAYPFEEAYFLPMARRFRAALKLPLVLLGGVNRLETVRGALGEGFDFVALGRALLREPDRIARWQRGDAADAACIHCNKCIPTIYRGTHCVLVPENERPGHRP
ncbi:MAG: NADH:flavin oxidoreductase [Deltaproteobacteria bacterium]|nr:NADH:flavin oxidoreductase [Deltaproteobacteria bacterium]